jgi:hypothetical protein
MLLSFELLGLGVSFDYLSSTFEFSELTMFSLCLNQQLNDLRPSGIVRELLHVPLLSNISNPQTTEQVSTDEFTFVLLTIPFLASCLAYVVIAVVFNVSAMTDLKTEVEEVIPQKIFCFRAIDLPEIVLSPPRTNEMPDFRRSDLWQSVMEEQEEVIEEEMTGFSQYLAPGSELEMFSPVIIPDMKFTLKTKRSFFGG